MKKVFTLPIIAILVLVLTVGGYFLIKGRGGEDVTDTTRKIGQTITGSDGFSFDETTPGYETYKDLIQGCPVKDCIPSIDNPQFETVGEADTWLNDSDVVFVLDYKGTAKAYPQRILNWHEIVNDEVSGDPLAVTFCPLCGSALAFDRRMDGQILEFGVSGKLKDNDLIMYDRQTETFWQQITGEAIVGELIGKELTQIPLSGMRWREFKEDFPQSMVLSRETGFSRNYDVSPYGSYEEDASTLFPVEGGVDRTIHPKTVVYGVEIGDEAMAYPEESLQKQGRIQDEIGGVSIEITYRNGKVTVVNKDEDEEIAATRLFWFAWKAFHPGTKLYNN